MRGFSRLHRTGSVLRRAISRLSASPRDCGAAPASAEALESRLLFAVAAAAGGSGLSANLSSNKTIRKQQLDADPSTVPAAGAISVSYNPAEVTLIGVMPASGYTIDENASQIQLNCTGEETSDVETSSEGDGSSPSTFTEPLSDYIAYAGEGGGPTETGEVDIYFCQTSTGTPGQTPLSPGFTEVGEAGPLGVDTFSLVFQVVPGVSLAMPKYTVFANPNAIGGQPDFLETQTGQKIVAGAASIAPATIGGPPQGLSVTPDATNPAANDLFINDNAATANDTVLVNPTGRSLTGSTGVTVNATLNGVRYNTTYTQDFAAIQVYLQDGNDNVVFFPLLTIKSFVTAGKGKDCVSLGSGTNSITLGDGNDNVLAIGVSNTVSAGNGADNIVVGNILLSKVTNSVTLGNGNDNVVGAGASTTVNGGNGNDNVVLANGSNSVDLGNGNDNVIMGNGSNEFVDLGNGNDNVTLGNGSNDYLLLGSGTDNVQIGNGNNNAVVFYAGIGKDKVKFGTGTGNGYGG